MRSFVFVACFLAASLLAHPASIDRRCTQQGPCDDYPTDGYSQPSPQSGDGDDDQDQPGSNGWYPQTQPTGNGGYQPQDDDDGDDDNGTSGLPSWLGNNGSPQYNGGGFGGYTASSYRSSEQRKQQSSESQFSTDGNGGFSQYRKDSQSSSSSQVVINTFSQIGSQVGQLQNQLSSGSLTQQVAVQKMTELASAFKQGLSQAPSCNCLDDDPLQNTVGGVFSQFTQLLYSMKSQYKNGYNQVIMPFGQIQNSFESFAKSVSSSKVSMTSFIPSTMPLLLSPAVPALPSMINESK